MNLQVGLCCRCWCNWKISIAMLFTNKKCWSNSMKLVAQVRLAGCASYKKLGRDSSIQYFFFKQNPAVTCITMCGSQKCNDRIWKTDIQKFWASHKLDPEQPKRDLAVLYRLHTADKVRLGMSMAPDVCCLGFSRADTFLGHESWVCWRKCVLVNLLFFCNRTRALSLNGCCYGEQAFIVGASLIC